VQVAPEKILSQLQQLTVALVDASSIIYMVKAGFFELAADNLELHSPEQIIQETGYRKLKIAPLAGIDLPPDNSLLYSAEQLGWPVITDDKEIMKTLAARRLVYFNALMVLEYLSFRKLLTAAEYSDHRGRLLFHAWYGPEIVRIAGAVHKAALQAQRH
jgi:hypothetical protein